MTQLLIFLAATILAVAWMMIRAAMEDEDMKTVWKRNSERADFRPDVSLPTQENAIMGRRKDETEAQYMKRLRYVEKERWFIDNVWPWVVFGGILLFFGYFIFVHDEYVDPRHPPDPPKPYYQGR